MGIARYAGPKLRVFTVFELQRGVFDIRRNFGSMSVGVVEDFVTKYGAREAALLIPDRENWDRGVDAGYVNRRLAAWRKSCMRDGLNREVKL
jgi:hypothetical protein